MGSKIVFFILSCALVYLFAVEEISAKPAPGGGGGSPPKPDDPNFPTFCYQQICNPDASSNGGLANFDDVLDTVNVASTDRRTEDNSQNTYLYGACSSFCSAGKR